MDNQIFLTSPIDNDNGFVDWIQMITEWRKDQGDLNVIIDSPGGSIFSGFRMARAIAEHPSKTIAHVRGVAASMAGVLLAFFDKVTIDEHSTIMLHQAHIGGESGEDVSESDQKALNDFNKTAAKLMKSRGMSQKLVNEIFKGEAKDFWFTAKEAKDAGIVDEITKVVRKDGSPKIKIAASLENSQNKYNQYMSLFGKKKPEDTPEAVQSGRFKDETGFVFKSKSNVLAVGNEIARIGSNESLEGTHELEDGSSITVDDKSVVTEVGEADNSVEARLAAIETRQDLPSSEEVKQLTDAFNGATSAMKAAGKGTGFVLPKVEGKEEGGGEEQSDASLASEMKNVIKAVGKETK